MDDNARFSVSNGDRGTENGGIDVKISKNTNNSSAPLSGFSNQYSANHLPLPGFETLFENPNSFANDPVSAVDIDSFLAEQGEEFRVPASERNSTCASNDVNGKNIIVGKSGSGLLTSSVPSCTTDSKGTTPTIKMNEEQEGENFMGFQPLDSNGNANDGPAIPPLKLQKNSLGEFRREHSLESSGEKDDDVSNVSSYSGVADDVDSPRSEAEQNVDEEEEMEVDQDDVDSALSGNVDAEPVGDNSADDKKLNEEESESENEGDLREAEENGDLSDSDVGERNEELESDDEHKSDENSVAELEAEDAKKGSADSSDDEHKSDENSDTELQAGESKLDVVNISGDKHKSEKNSDRESTDHIYSRSPHSDLVDVEGDLTETEDEGKLVIDDDSDQKLNDTKSGNERDVDIKGADPSQNNRSREHSAVRGFESQTPDLPLGASDEVPYCWCGGEETEDMIYCENRRCKIHWYHYECVNVKKDAIPEGEWHCPTCKETGIKKESSSPGQDAVSSELVSIDSEGNKRQRKQTLKMREAAKDDDIDFEITLNADDSDEKPDPIELIDDPLTGGKVKKEKRTPKKHKIFKMKDFGSGSDSEMMELPSWHDNPKELFEGLQRPNGPKAAKLRKPFEHGWGREIVVRFKYESLKGSGRPPMDVYYFTPEGKKLRSFIQIRSYLDLSKEDFGLTTDHFSFNRIPVHKEPWEKIRMANVGRSAGSVRGHANKGYPSPRTLGEVPVKIGRPPKTLISSTPKHIPLYVPEKIEKPKSFPEMLDLKPVTATSPLPTILPAGTQKAKKSFRPTEPAKRLLSPLEMTMPDPKKIKIMKAGMDRRDQPPKDVGFRLCSLDCPNQQGKAPTLHCGVCMCLFHPECVQFVGTRATLFVCTRCRKNPQDTSSKEKTVSMTYQSPSSLPSDVMLPLTIEKGSTGQDTLLKFSVPPPPSLKPMTVAAQLKCLEHEHSKQNVVSWGLSDGNMKFPLSQPPPLKTVVAPFGQIPSVVSVQNKSNIPGTPNVPSAANVVRAALVQNHVQNIAQVSTSGSPTVVSAGASNANDIRMAGQLLTLPGNIISRIKMNEPLALKINNQSLVVNPDCFVQTSHGVKIFLPPNTLPVQSGNKTINITVPQTNAPSTGHVITHSTSSTLQGSTVTPVSVGGISSPPSVNVVTPIIKTLDMPISEQLNVKKKYSPVQELSAAKCYTPITEITSMNNFSSFTEQSTLKRYSPSTEQSTLRSCLETPVLNHVPQAPASQSPRLISAGLVAVNLNSMDSYRLKRPRRKTNAINPANCFIKQLHGGYDCLLQIFSYLPVPDLLRAGKVCRRWKSIIRETWMWRHVRLRGTYVTDWDVAMEFLQKVETKKLDLRGLRHIDDRNRTWHQIVGVLDKMTHLHELNFGQCPASILHAVCDKLSELRVLTAEWITEIFDETLMWTTNTKLDMAKFANLTHLEELRLRGVCGLVLPSFSFAGGLDDLSRLQSLKKLSITTLKDVPANDFSFICQLSNLVELEIGDCTFWNEQTYSQLSKLEHLNILRLENGGSLDDTGLAVALKSLKQLTKLELVMFVIPPSLSGAVVELKNLRELSVWPDPRHQPAVVNSNTLTAVSKLPWLTRLEWGVVTSADDEDDQSNEGGKHRTLPFLKERKKKKSKVQEEKSILDTSGGISRIETGDKSSMEDLVVGSEGKLIMDAGKDPAVDNGEKLAMDTTEDSAVDNGGKLIMDTGEDLAVESEGKLVMDTGKDTAVESEGKLVMDTGEDSAVESEVKLVMDTGEDSAVESEGKLVKDTGECAAVKNEGKSVVAAGEDSAMDTEGELVMDTGKDSAAVTEEKLVTDTGKDSAVVSEEKSVMDTTEDAAADTGGFLATDTEKNSAVDSDGKLAMDTENNLAVDTDGKLAMDTMENSAVDTGRKLEMDTKENSAVDTDGKLAMDTEKDLAVETVGKLVVDTNDDSAMDMQDNSAPVDVVKEEEETVVEEEFITTQCLHDRLSGILVETNVIVNDVAVLASQNGRSRTKST